MKYYPIFETTLCFGRFPSFAYLSSDKSITWLKLNMKNWWNDIDRGKQKYSEKNMSQCHVDRPGIQAMLSQLGYLPKFCTKTESVSTTKTVSVSILLLSYCRLVYRRFRKPTDFVLQGSMTKHRPVRKV